MTAQQHVYCVRLAERGVMFSTRDRGARMFAELAEQLEHGYSSVLVDLSGVVSISYSFADEFIGELMARSAAGEFPHATFANADESALRSINLSLANRGISAAHRV